MKYLFFGLIGIMIYTANGFCETVKTETPAPQEAAVDASQYVIGVDDLLDLVIIQPDQLSSTVTVSPDGAITVPYVGNLIIEGMTLAKAQELISAKLTDGYLKYPVVNLVLREGRSKKFFIYGEVVRPGTYMIGENVTALKAISMAGGFTKYASSSSVKILRPQKDSKKFQTIKVNLGAIMSGNSNADILIMPGDTIVVSESIF